MADGNQEGLTPQGTESAPEDVFSGDLTPQGDESPEGNVSKGSESPETDNGSGKSASQSGDSDLDGIFSDLETDIPETLKPHASNVKKKLQKFFTQKNQKVSDELRTLRENQVTEQFRDNYNKLYNWYEKLNADPVQGIRELASRLGVKPETLLAGSGEARAAEPELDPSQLETREDYVRFARQEIRKVADEIREKEVKPLKDTLSTIQGGVAQKQNIERGSKAIDDAKTLPGFANENGELSEEANKAIALVIKGYFKGEDALKNAFLSLTGPNYLGKVKELEEKLKTLKSNVRGVSNTPGGQTPKTITPPMTGSIEDRWARMTQEPLS